MASISAFSGLRFAAQAAGNLVHAKSIARLRGRRGRSGLGDPGRDAKLERVLRRPAAVPSAPLHRRMTSTARARARVGLRRTADRDLDR